MVTLLLYRANDMQNMVYVDGYHFDFAFWDLK